MQLILFSFCSLFVKTYFISLQIYIKVYAKIKELVNSVLTK